MDEFNELSLEDSKINGNIRTQNMIEMIIEWIPIDSIAKDQSAHDNYLKTCNHIFISSDNYSNLVSSCLLNSNSDSTKLLGRIYAQKKQENKKSLYGEIFRGSSADGKLFLILQFAKPFNGNESVLSFLKSFFSQVNITCQIVILHSEKQQRNYDTSVPSLTQINNQSLISFSSASSINKSGRREDGGKDDDLDAVNVSFWPLFSSIPLLSVGSLVTNYWISSLMNFLSIRKFPVILLVHNVTPDDRTGILRNLDDIVLAKVRQFLSLTNTSNPTIQKNPDLMKHFNAILSADDSSLYL
jgi:hypothetical protein